MPHSSPFPLAPLCLEGLHQKLIREIRAHALKEPSRPALISAEDPSKRVSFGALIAESERVNGFLRLCRFRRGDVAAVVLHNCIEWASISLGVWSAGGAISGASALFTDYEFARQFVDSRCSFVFTDGAHLAKVLKAAEGCVSVQHIVCLEEKGASRSSATSQPRIYDWSQVMAAEPCTELANVSPEDVAIIPYSSGTTGSPKGVMQAHRGFGCMTNIFKQHFDVVVAPFFKNGELVWEKEHLLLNLPLYHMFGFGVLALSLSSGATGVVLRAFEPRLYCKVLETYKIRMVFLVPPILLFLTKSPIANEFDVSSLECVTTGAAPAGRDICEEFLAKFKHVHILGQGYGLTECGMASHLVDTGYGVDSHFGLGRVTANFEIKIIDPATGVEVPNGTHEEVCTRSPTLMLGYLNRPDETAKTIDRDGWLHTGDLGYVEADGRTFLVDRLKELIKVKGLQVAPAELEDVLLTHPRIADAAVIGLPDSGRGEFVRAYVVRKDDKLREEEVCQYVAGKLSPYKHITGGVVFLEAIPKSAAGKILRRELRELAAHERRAAKI